PQQRSNRRVLTAHTHHVRVEIVQTEEADVLGEPVCHGELVDESIIPFDWSTLGCPPRECRHDPRASQSLEDPLAFPGGIAGPHALPSHISRLVRTYLVIRYGDRNSLSSILSVQAGDGMRGSP